MALAPYGYSDTQIQKMGRWKGASFKEYIHEDLACYSGGMLRDTRRSFGFVNIAAGANKDILVDVKILRWSQITTPDHQQRHRREKPQNDKIVKWCDKKMVK